jgi:DNA-binding NtrC family response regulator
MTNLKKNLSLRILVVDDDKNICRALGLSLKDTQCVLITANSADEAITKLKENDFDLILTDFKMQGKTGLDLIKEVKPMHPETLTVVMTAYASIENAIAVMREGAYDYLPKPFTNDQFIHFLNRIQNLIDLKRENKNLKKPWVRRDFFAGLTSTASRSLEDFVRKMAPTDATVLLTGESGTGKSELAKLIHELSPRASKPFITVYCTTLTESLLESELFGHVKGSFTGATTDKIGQLQAAEGGTLFLDEVGDLTPAGQAKLLRFLQDKVFQKVGGNEEISVNTRILAATNRDLTEAVQEGKFREDLYYRLNTLEVMLVSLRHRKEDIAVYIDRFLKEIKKTGANEQVQSIPKEVQEKLLTYDWPGNLRELRNTVQRLIMLSQGRPIMVSDLPPAFRQEPRADTSESPYRSLEEVEKTHILALLERESSLEKATEILGITKATLWRKRKQYGLI